MKKVCLRTALIVLLVCVVWVGVGCTDGDPLARAQYEAAGYPYVPGSTKQITLYVQQPQGDPLCIPFTTRQDFLHDALKEMQAEGLLERYVFSAGDNHDAFVTALGPLESTTLPSGLGGSYLALLHQMEKIASTDPANIENGRPKTVEVDSKTFYYSADGFGLTPLVDGLSYYVALLHWGAA